MKQLNKINYVALTVSVDYMDQSFKEIMDFDSGAKVEKQFPSGIMLVKPSLSQEDFVRLLVEKRPVFVRHASAFDLHFYFADYDNLCSQAEEALRSYVGRAGENDTVGVQIRKAVGDYNFEFTEIKGKLDKIIETQWKVQTAIKEPTQIISILLINNQCFMGMAIAKNNVSSWSGGMVHYKKDDALDISRAKFKLMEGIYVFNINMEKIKTAIDLGAAPGGWTSVLMEYGIEVTAVDTGAVDERLLKSPLINYINANVSELKLEDKVFDMLTSDISWNPINTAKMVKEASKYLKTGGIAVVTVKLMGDKVWKIIKEVRKIYEENFEILGAKQLFHNRDEITIYMKKRQEE